MNFCKCSAAVLCVLFMLVAGSAYAQIVLPIHLELVGPDVEKNGTFPIPGDGSRWHEIYPNWCSEHVQIRYDDNGDGYISTCDLIRFSIGYAHVENVVQTFHLYHPDAGTILVEWDEAAGVFHEVYPDYCSLWDPLGADWWQDGGNGIQDECDTFRLIRQGETIGFEYHVTDVRTNIRIDTLTPADPGNWGTVKAFFRQILE